MPVPCTLRLPSASGRFRPALQCLDGRHQRLSRDGGLRCFRVARLRRGLCDSRGPRLILMAALPGEHRHRGAAAAGSRQETMTRKQQRMGLLALGMAALGGATLLVLSAFNDNLVFFYSPSELKATAVAADRLVRIGGLVEANILSRVADAGCFSFRITDGPD